MSQHKVPQMNALNKLIDSFSSKIEGLKAEQEKVTKETESRTSDTELSDFIANSPVKTYNEIENTLKTALEILENAKLWVESAPDPETYSSISSLLTSIQGMFSEFTDIWKKQIEFQNNVNMENLRFQNKKLLEDHKYKLKLKYFNETNVINPNESNNNNVPFNTLDFIANINKANKTKAVNAEFSVSDE